jgi:hypothetical protein
MEGLPLAPLLQMPRHRVLKRVTLPHDTGSQAPLGSGAAGMPAHTASGQVQVRSGHTRCISGTVCSIRMCK